MDKEQQEAIEDEFIGFWDAKKESLCLGRYSSDVTTWWLSKLDQAYEAGRDSWRKEMEEDKVKFL